jgi:hypothetical protein
VLEFAATAVQVYKDDDSETIVGFYGADGDGKPRYLELHLVVRTVRGRCDFEIKVEVGRPRRVGRDCVTVAELRRGQFEVAFADGGSLAKIGRVRVSFAIDGKAYRQLKRGVEEVFCVSEVLRVVPVGSAEPGAAPARGRKAGRGGGT